MTKRSKASNTMEFLANVASLYYEQGLNQDQIASQLGYSRSAISRFLTTAHERGVVEIRINYPYERDHALEEKCKQRFHLDEVIILSRGNLDDNSSLPIVGALAARAFESRVEEQTYLGVSWGTAVFEVANALRMIYLPGTCVIQLLGAFGTPDPRIDGSELVRTFSRKLSGSYRSLPAPALVENLQVRDALLNDRPIREVLELARAVELAIVGIGTTDPKNSSFLRAGYLTTSELTKIRQQGAVGDVCGIHFNLQGQVQDFNITDRVVGIDESELRAIPQTIGVAAGAIKAPAILGALRANFIDVLVIDDAAAQKMLELAAKKE